MEKTPNQPRKRSEYPLPELCFLQSYASVARDSLNQVNTRTHFSALTKQGLGTRDQKSANYYFILQVLERLIQNVFQQCWISVLKRGGNSGYDFIPGSLLSKGTEVCRSPCASRSRVNSQGEGRVHGELACNYKIQNIENVLQQQYRRHMGSQTKESKLEVAKAYIWKCLKSLHCFHSLMCFIQEQHILLSF